MPFSISKKAGNALQRENIGATEKNVDFSL
jgi:hypothetical protein